MNRTLRTILTTALRVRAMLEGPFDRWYLDKHVPLIDHHSSYAALITDYNRPGMRVQANRLNGGGSFRRG